MSENLGNFLVDLTCNPDLMARFLGDPAAVLAESSLNDHERTLVMTRDSRLLADALGANGFSLGLGVGVTTPTRKAPGRKRPARKAPPKKKTPPKKSPARAPAKRKAPARKMPVRKTPVKKSPRKSPRKKS